MKLKSRAVRNALAGSAVSVLTIGLAAAPAQADHGHDNPCKPSRVHCKFKAKSNLKAIPTDSGGRNAKARITGFRGGDKYAADFQAYDEVLYLRDGYADNHKALVKIRYYGPGGPYKYRYKTGSRRAIQLGSDDDLTENKRIKFKLCIHHHKCTKWAKGWT